MNSKYCPRCNCITNIIKFGATSAGRHRYQCKVCKKTWVSKPRPNKLIKSVWEDYCNHYFTIADLCDKYQKSHTTIEKYLNSYQVPALEYKSSGEVIIMDTTYFGRSYGVLIVIDANSKETLYRKELGRTERVIDYWNAIYDLAKHNIHPKACLIDGRRGVKDMLEEEGILVQACQFHQIALVNRCLTRKPKIQANSELRDIALSLTHVTRKQFEQIFFSWYLKHSLWMEEYTIKDGTKEYRHPKTRQAFYSIKSNLPYLFTFQEHPELHIPNTSNALESRFRGVKTKARIHSGISKSRKTKILFSLLS